MTDQNQTITDPVYVASIHNNSGVTAHVFSTADKALAHIADYARQFWDERYDWTNDRPAEETKTPTSDKDAVLGYFYDGNRDGDTYEIAVCEIDGLSRPLTRDPDDFGKIEGDVISRFTDVHHTQN